MGKNFGIIFKKEFGLYLPKKNIFFLQNGHYNRHYNRFFSRCVGKCSCDRLRYKIYIRQRCEFCATIFNNNAGCAVKCDRLRKSEGVYGFQNV
jgi:hypothetical protein